MIEGLPYKRVLVKVSGEGLMGAGEYGVDKDAVSKLAQDIKAVVAAGRQICLVIGGGNIFRGLAGAATGMDRTTADYMGMLATIINALAIQNALEAIGVATRVQSAIAMAQVCESYIRRRAVRHMEKGRVVIFAAGTGNPFFTTDTAAALRAVEMNCDALLKATQVDGVYDVDPNKNKGAKRYDCLTFDQILADNLQVMDTTAIALARENQLSIIVFNMHEDDAIAHVLEGRGKFTCITSNAAA